MSRISAPGKVLLLGGYSVLDYYPALSIALNDSKGMGVIAESEIGKKHTLVSKEYGIDTDIDDKRLFSVISESSKEHKVALTAYCISLAYLKAEYHKLHHLKIELNNSEIFGKKHEKSGLGSSGASTVALVAAIFEGNGLGIEENKDKIHKLAQLSHAMSMEKVGSGFDIATSAYGTIQYVRYSSDFVELITKNINSENFDKTIKDAINKDWPTIWVKPFVVEGFDLLLFNIKGAKTSTVSSVKAVKKMKEYAPEIYKDTITLQSEEERKVLEDLKKKNWKAVRESMHSARNAQRKITEWIYRVGMLYFDPIEPEPLTKIIDESEKLEGVVAGRCPGSGGYDSVAFIVTKKDIKLISGIKEIGKKNGINLENIECQISIEGVKKL